MNISNRGLVATVAGATVAGVIGVAALLSGCSTGPAVETTPAVASVPNIHALGDGFLGGNPSPTPEATVSPKPGSWDGVVPPAGYRVVLITAGTDAAAVTLATAVRAWAKSESVDLEVLKAGHDDDVEDHINAAVALKPDLVIGAGDGVVDVFTQLTPQHLAQHFLMIGAELPEPTENVSSVIWPGAAYRGTGLGTSGEVDPATFTPARADEAVRAGVASMLHGLSGIVLSLPE